MPAQNAKRIARLKREFEVCPTRIEHDCVPLGLEDRGHAKDPFVFATITRVRMRSFAAQGAGALPPDTRLPLLLISVALILGAMFYWLVRVLLTRWAEQVQPAP